MCLQTASMLQVFILAMVLFPEVQKKAQRVIDVTVGTSRLPVWTDRPSLKYIDAVLRETLRWHPILPLCKMSLIFIQLGFVRICPS